MDYKLQMHKLEKIKISKLNEMKELHREIGKIEEAISKNNRLYMLLNKHSDEANEILKDYGKQNVKEILKFILDAVVGGVDSAYTNQYKNIDMKLLLEDDEFFDFAIVQIGKPTIDALKKTFNKVVEQDGETFIEHSGKVPRHNNDNLKKRLYKKMGKGSVFHKAQELAQEKGYTKC